MNENNNYQPDPEESFMSVVAGIKCEFDDFLTDTCLRMHGMTDKIKREYMKCDTKEHEDILNTLRGIIVNAHKEIVATQATLNLEYHTGIEPILIKEVDENG